MGSAGPEGRPDRRTTQTRERIQAVALELFSTKGFSATSLRDIAQELGLTKAALYYHFPAKADLARSIFQPLMDDIDGFLDRMEGHDLPRQRFLEAYFDVLVPHRREFAALIRDASVLAYVDIEEATVRWVERLQHLLVGPDATVADRVRATVAVAGLSRCVVLTDLPLEDIRTAGVQAALAALRG